jgi:hypothetical protein
VFSFVIPCILYIPCNSHDLHHKGHIGHHSIFLFLGTGFQMVTCAFHASQFEMAIIFGMPYSCSLCSFMFRGYVASRSEHNRGKSLADNRDVKQSVFEQLQKSIDVLINNAVCFLVIPFSTQNNKIHVAKSLRSHSVSHKILCFLRKPKVHNYVHMIHKLINSVWNKELPEQSKESIIVSIHIKRVIKLTVIIIVGYHCYQLHTKLYRISSQG